MKDLVFSFYCLQNVAVKTVAFCIYINSFCVLQRVSRIYKD